MKNSWWVAVAGIVTAALIVIGCVIVFTSDRKAPEIRIEDIGFTYHEGDSKGVLLTGVTATDKRDGDVTDSIIIESIVISENKQSVRVCYVAKDKSNNIVRAYRTVSYEAGTGDGSTDDGNSGGEGETSDDTGSGKSDSTGTGDNKQESQGTEENKTQASDNTASGENQTAVANGEKPVLVLKMTEATLKVGDRFNVVSYVADIADNKDDRSTLYTRIIADGNCDTSKAGDYTVTVYCSDTDMNYSDKQTLVVHVAE